MKSIRKSTVYLMITVIVLWLILCWRKYLWFDEAYSLAMIRHNISEICNITAADVHPPMYYIMLKIFSKIFGHTILVARIFSLIPSIMILIIGAYWLNKRVNYKCANIFIVLMFCNPFFMQYVNEIRMYTWGALFVFIAGISAYEIYKFSNNILNLLVLVVSGVLAAYTHYFALVSVGIIYIILFFALILKKRYLFAKFTIAVLMSIILYIPWLTKFLSQIKFKIDNPYWIPPITLDTIKGYFIQMVQPMDGSMYCVYIIGVTSFILILIYLYKVHKGLFENNDIVLLGLLVPMMTIIVGVSISLIIRPIFIIRYIVPAFPYFIIAFSVIMANIKFGKLLMLLTVLNIVVGVSAYAVDIQKSYLKKDYINKLVETQYDSVVSWTNNTDVVSALDYLRNKPIYVYGGYLTAAIPFVNMQPYEEDTFSKLQGTVLILSGDRLPKDFVKQNNLHSLGKFSLFHGDQVFGYTMHR